MNKRLFLQTAAITGGALASGLAFDVAAAASGTTFVLVHGAFAGSDGWADVTRSLQRKGHGVIAVANPLRGVASDSAAVAAVVDSLAGPVVLVGHSYGGMLISNAALGRANVKGLVYVGAFAPDAGESVADLAGKFPGSTLGDALAPVALPGGGKDLYIARDKYHQQFCADLPAARAAILATDQRPIAEAALGEKSAAAAWKQIPSWHVYGTADRNIPAAAMGWMAERANARRVVQIKGASHVPHMSHAATVASLIAQAAGSAA